MMSLREILSGKFRNCFREDMKERYGDIWEKDEGYELIEIGLRKEAVPLIRKKDGDHIEDAHEERCSQKQRQKLLFFIYGDHLQRDPGVDRDRKEKQLHSRKEIRDRAVFEQQEEEDRKRGSDRQKAPETADGTSAEEIERNSEKQHRCRYFLTVEKQAPGK